MALPVADETFAIKKRVLFPGKGDFSDFRDGTKITFHYKTLKCDEEHTVVDDSQTHSKPMELILGKKFKLEVWEKCLKTMKMGEVSSFTVDSSLLGAYPLVSKSLRDIHHGRADSGHHCCGMAMKEHGLGYVDLDDMLKKPENLEFILDVKKIEEPGEYKKDVWAMDVAEKLAAIPKLKEEGNKIYRDKNYITAAEKYSEALGMLEELLLREKPGEDEWLELDKQKTPLLLNFSQCKLLLKDYYSVIEHTSDVLKKDPDNVKALYRRAKAHVGAWNPDDARTDFKRVMELDPTLVKNVQKELALLLEAEKQKNREDREKYKGKIFG